jgi:hypothetical protein
MDTNADNKLDLNTLGSISGKEKTVKLFEALVNYPKHIPYADRLRDLSARTGITPKHLQQTARRHDWVKRLQNIVEEQEKQEELGKLLDTANAPKGSTDVPFSMLGKGIKNLSMLALNASLQFVSTTVVLIDYYAKRIAHAVALAGGVSHLDEETAKRVRHWQQELAVCTKSVSEYIKPQALSALLQLINFSQNLPADMGEIDQSAFTMDSLYQKLKELGMMSAFDQPDQAVEGYGPLPNIDAWTNTASGGRDAPIDFGLPKEL